MRYKDLPWRHALSLFCLLASSSANQALAAAQLSYPSPEQSLGETVDFGWNIDPDALGYWLSVVDGAGARYSNYQVLGKHVTGATISGLPAGEPFTAELITIYLDGNNVTNWDTRQKTQFNSPAARISAPANSSLNSTSHTFNWNSIEGVSLYYWSLSDDFGNSWFNADVGRQTQVTISNLPTDGRTLYSNLYTVIGNNWDRVSKREFIAHTGEVAVSPIWSPSPGTTWQWQLNGEINTSFDVQMYDIDLFDAPQATIDSLKNSGRAVICYFSAGSSEIWRPDAASVPLSVQGNGNGWEGEKWLDIRAIEKLSPVMRSRLDLAVAKGCDGVEPDNVDGYTNNTGFPLTASDQLVFNRWLATEAHARGLSIGLKNDVDQIVELEPWFDWAINEQCAEYNECDQMTPFIDAGKAVFGVEYSGNSASFCPGINALNFDWLIKDIELTDTFETCR